MKKIQYIQLSLLCLLTSILLVVNSFGQNLPAKPNPPRLVNDFAGILSSNQQSQLENKLVALDDSTSNQITILTIKTLNDYPIEDYANKLFRSWGIGNKKTNNGVLILVAVDDRKFRIEVGQGLEGAIPDITASDIMVRQMTPAFRSGDYFTGLNRATDALAAAAAGEYHVARQRPDDSVGGGSIVIFIIIVVAIIFIVRRGGGGGGGGMMSRRGSDTWIPPIWFGGGSGGGFGGGGFGGFGGGSSGGGGASGSW